MQAHLTVLLLLLLQLLLLLWPMGCQAGRPPVQGLPCRRGL